MSHSVMSHPELASLLVQLELSLKHHGLWQSAAPSAAALASSAPFCCDTLSFEQWLQFIFIPRVNALLDAGHTLPRPMALLPMAEHVWAAKPELTPLVQLIALLDDTVNASR
ncbi:YqcC family protein [Shewanella jiangmenensis]|nr:YqcC family protein [Shewanella jiangmenensis]